MVVASFYKEGNKLLADGMGGIHTNGKEIKAKLAWRIKKIATLRMASFAKYVLVKFKSTIS